MRLFIEIPLPEEVRESVFQLQKSLHILPAKINWVAKKNMHITLKFLGEVSEEQKNLAEKELAKIRFSKFTVTLSNIGVFPNYDRARVIWIGLNPEEKVISLQRQIDEQLLSFFPKDQTFEAHLTIGRVKLVKKKEEVQAILRETKAEKKNFAVDSFKLMKSELTKSGPIYEELKTFYSA
ncbi:RNA 2',3'-cyclic phosphodiesterase [Candidatus Woesearchaeota archaeon]|nr:RNA 2',3'-cyclic phosphodiesterase [Candidatus Woesearchaeota archaeon]